MDYDDKRLTLGVRLVNPKSRRDTHDRWRALNTSNQYARVDLYSFTEMLGLMQTVPELDGAVRDWNAAHHACLVCGDTFFDDPAAWALVSVAFGCKSSAICAECVDADDWPLGVERALRKGGVFCRVGWSGFIIAAAGIA